MSQNSCMRNKVEDLFFLIQSCIVSPWMDENWMYNFFKSGTSIKLIEDDETIPPLFHEIFNLENQKWYSYF